MIAPASQAATLLTLAALAGCSPREAEAPRAPERRGLPFPVIDAHIHTEFTGQPEPNTGILQTREELFRELREAGVTGAVAHTGSSGEDYVDLRAEGVVHCAGVDAVVDVARVEDGLRTGKYACIKIYLGYVHQYAHDPAYEPAYELAARYRAPVVFHTGDTYSERAKLKYADPLTIDEVAVDHPAVTFVIAHCGNPWIQSAAEVAYKNPNVVLEGSALLIGDVSKEAREEVDRYMVEPLAWAFGYVEDPRKMLFGTDWPLNDVAAYEHAFQRAIPEEHWRAVFHDNAARVFKLGGVEQAR
jgi:predicted TIM-barrel fold metal-dependent hydrolase